jgi:protein TonB
MADGRLQPDSARIKVSSGQATMDLSTLQTVRRSAPFDVPPEQMTGSIVVAFGQTN